jgi:argininosuccinate lyase
LASSQGSAAEAVAKYFELMTETQKLNLVNQLNTQRMEQKHGVVDASDEKEILEMMQRLIEHEKQADLDRAWLQGIAQKTENVESTTEDMDYDTWQANQNTQELVTHMKDMEERLIISQDEILKAAADLIELREKDLELEA